MTRYDVAISGAGPAGSIAALVLARSGARVLLLDRAAFPRDKPCAEYLSPEINVLLDELGLAGAVAAIRPARLRGFLIYTQRGSAFRAAFAGRSAGVAARERGLAAPRLLFDETLLRAALNAGAEVRERVRVLGVEAGPDAALVTLHGGREERVTARLVLAADGVRSPLARRLGLLRRGAPHRIALVTHMVGIDGLGEYGEMHASPDGGYCGIAPLGDGRANVAMVVSDREGQRMAGDPAGYLRAALRTYPQLGPRVRQATPCKPVLTTSDLSWSARHYHSGSVALAGDATGYYDPFTGEGIYRAMAGGRLVGRRLLEALDNGDTAAALSAYERDLRRLYRGKRLVERIVDVVVHHPLLFEHVARRLQRHPEMADTLVGVTGDFLPPWQVLKPTYLARLIL